MDERNTRFPERLKELPLRLRDEHIKAREKARSVLDAAGVSELASLYGPLVLAIANALIRERRDCAALFCSHCATGDIPQWRVEFQGYTHIWTSGNEGNRYSKCAAYPIWDSTGSTPKSDSTTSTTQRNPNSDKLDSCQTSSD